MLPLVRRSRRPCWWRCLPASSLWAAWCWFAALSGVGSPCEARAAIAAIRDNDGRRLWASERIRGGGRDQDNVWEFERQ